MANLRREDQWRKSAMSSSQLPIPHPPKLLSGDEIEKIRSKVEIRKKRGMGERYFKISVYFSLSYSGWTGNIKIQLISPS